MSVTNEVNKVNYTATGLSSFAIPFYFSDNSHIKYYLNDVLKTFGTDYTLTGAGSPSGGTLTIVGTPPSSGAVTILRTIPFVQANTFNEGGQMPAKIIEKMFDTLTYICQQLSERISRAIKLPVSSTNLNPQIVGTILPGAIIQVNSTSDGLEMGPSVLSYSATLDAKVVAAAASQAAAESSSTSAGNSATSASGSASTALAASAAATTQASFSASSAVASAVSASNASTSESNAANSANISLINALIFG